MRRPLRFRHPTPGLLGVVGRWPDRVLDPRPQHRFGHDAGFYSFQPVIPPAQAFLQETDLRTGLGEMRILVGPGSDQPLARPFEIGQQPADGVGIAIGPSTDRIDRAGDGIPVLAHRAMLVEAVAALAGEPFFQPEPTLIETRHPQIAPGFADARRIGRSRVERKHGRAPGQLVDEERTAHEMNIVAITIIGGAQRDHRLKLRRAPGRHLQPVEAAPRNADHPNLAGAPRLL